MRLRTGISSDRILEAVAARDPVATDNAVQEHLRSVCEFWIAMTMEGSTEPSQRS